MKNYLKIVHIDNNSIKPKYLQLVEAIETGIATALITNGDNLPSIHEFCVSLDVSKTTVQKAYTILKERGVVASCPGRGHYIFADLFDKQA